MSLYSYPRNGVIGGLKSVEFIIAQQIGPTMCEAVIDAMRICSENNPQGENSHRNGEWEVTRFKEIYHVRHRDELIIQLFIDPSCLSP